MHYTINLNEIESDRYGMLFYRVKSNIFGYLVWYCEKNKNKQIKKNNEMM